MEDEARGPAAGGARAGGALADDAAPPAPGTAPGAAPVAEAIAPPSAAPAAARRTRWISRGVESLFAELPRRRETDADVLDADVLIVGSGYGGAIAADRLAAKTKLKVVLLERGLEYLPGAFPARAAELPGHLRFTTPAGKAAKGRLEGLFDLRIGADISVLLGNGVGGGSLINAGVMEFPLPQIFASGWPAALPAYSDLSRRADKLKLREELGAQSLPTDSAAFDRTHAMGLLGARRVPITVALGPGQTSSGGVALNPCIACGDCATGCNHGAKISLDLNLLRRATERGVELFTGATVSRLRRRGDHWEAQVWHTDAQLRQRMARGEWIRARRVILAAGTLGSTEILLRSQTIDLQFSKRLGRGFSGNGDVLASLFDARLPLGGVADEDQAPAARHLGPTITSMLDERKGGDGFAVQDLGVPGPLRRLFEEAATTGDFLQRLGEKDRTQHGDPAQQDAPDPMAVDPSKMKRSITVALICRDSAAGVMSPVPDDADFPADAGLRIDWKEARNDERIPKAHDGLAAALARSDLAKDWPARLLPNPMWRLLPPRIASLLNTKLGPLITVHPLGGCAMGDERECGVTNVLGQVFDGTAAQADAVHPDLVVLDGSIVPMSLGINPALTIATLADLAITQLIEDWGCPRETDPPGPQPAVRPVFQLLPDPTPPAKTEVQLIERLAGWIDFKDIGSRWVELDLVYQNRALFPDKPDGSRQGFTQDGHHLPVAKDSTLSRLRVFKEPGSPFQVLLDPRTPEFDAPLLPGNPDHPGQGSELHFFHREPSTYTQRRCRAWTAWLWNRGLRDIVQTKDNFASVKKVVEWYQNSLALASRGGEVRRFDYRLQLGPPQADGAFASLRGRAGLQVEGSKRFSYERRSNPWTQLMRLSLGDTLLGIPLGARRTLDVSPAYFAVKGIPLLRVVAQQDQPGALIDLLCFAAYLARVFINVHVWSLRKPDAASQSRVPQRLPMALPGLPAPEVHRLKPDGACDDAEIRLTRYPKAGTRHVPVLLIHGYSASGTTFAHPVLQPSLAADLWAKGFEPWVLDLRTSCGMPSADRPYTFEEIALHDIPAAVRKVCQLSGAERIDVISHCMGSAMLSMTLQADAPCGPHTAARMRRWVMSQFGPRMRFSPANILRAYLISFFRQAVPDYRYSLRPDLDEQGANGNLYDRLVATIPYLNDEFGSEFDLENPVLPWMRTPWVGTRHRLDALIGRTFDSRRMSAEALDRIDDFFGPINLRTMSQPIYFAQMGEPTDDNGRGPFGQDAKPLLRDVRMLSLHGANNGLADPDTARLLKAWGRDLPLTVHPPFAGRGHQDLLIGRDCAEVFQVISDFLLKP